MCATEVERQPSSWRENAENGHFILTYKQYLIKNCFLPSSALRVICNIAFMTKILFCHKALSYSHCFKASHPPLILAYDINIQSNIENVFFLYLYVYARFFIFLYTVLQEYDTSLHISLYPSNNNLPCALAFRIPMEHTVRLVYKCTDKHFILSLVSRYSYLN